MNAIRQAHIDDKYRLEDGRVFVTGTQALVRLMLEQSRRDRQAGHKTGGFVSGYRGSPLGMVDQQFWRARPFLEPADIHFRPGVNEDLAATAVWGTQQVGVFSPGRVDGVFAMWYGKGPGVDRSGDPFKHGNMAGTSPLGGVICLAGDDHTAKSSTTAHQSEQAMIAAMMPIFNPANIQEYLDYGLYGFALSRFAGLWVGFKCLTDTVEGTASIAVGPSRAPVVLPEAPKESVHIRWPDDAVTQEKRMMSVKLPAALDFLRANALDRVTHDAPRRRIGIVTTGKSWLDVTAALGRLGLDEEAARARFGLSVYKLAVVWPLEGQGLRDWAQGQQEIIVIEEKRPVIEEQIARELINLPDGRRPRLVGKRDEEGGPLVPDFGALDSVRVARIIASRLLRIVPQDDTLNEAMAALNAATDGRNMPDNPVRRMPWFCSGCPHNTSTVVPEGSRAMAGIGCHTMAIYMPNRRTGAYTHMGGEGANWIGEAPFSQTKHIFQNLGDGTYFHSGLMAIRAAVAANVNITYKILYNDAVAMTGGQPVDGPLTPWDISRQVHDEGVRRIVVVTDDPDKYPAGCNWAEGVDIRHRDELDAVQRELREIEGVTVLIYDQTCAAEKRRRRKRGAYPDPARRVFINEEVCEGCGDCGIVSNCVAIKPLETPKGRKRMIDQTACNKDFTCLKGFCPSFVTVEGGGIRGVEAGNLPEPMDESRLPVPTLAPVNGVFNLLVTGIGGTGVVTVGALLGMAAHLQGLGVSVLDQTGLAQKNGAVTSHVRIARAPEDIDGSLVPAAGLDLLLGCDMVVAAQPDTASTFAPGRSRAVVNDHVVPIAAFALMPDLALDGESMLGGLRRLLDNRIDAVNATLLSRRLLGNEVGVNVFLLGYAVQKGLLPVDVDSLKAAIRMNGVAVEMNLRALTWGRQAAAFPDTLPAAEGEGSVVVEETLQDIVRDRVGELTAYQNRAYAARYEALVEWAQSAASAAGIEGDDFARAVARYAYKVMAYKDEYEVARLYTDGRFMRRLREQFEGDYKLHFHMAPPLLPADMKNGRPAKREFGPWMMTMLRLLARMKGLRGSWLDPFARSEERRREARLAGEYAALIEELCQGLTAENHDLAVKIASLPERIRGFGPVKARAMAEYDKALADLRGKFARKGRRAA